MKFQTIEQALNTKAVIIISSKPYEYKGEKRNWIKAKKAKGRKVFTVAQYADGTFSAGV